MRKEYPGTLALNWDEDDSLDIRGGEIHALVGENGAGKSTLLSLISGLQPASGGALELEGEPYVPSSVAAARSRGIEIVMQEPGLVGALTVAENFFLGRNAADTAAGIVLPGRGAEIVRRTLADVAPHVSPRTLAASLSLEDHKLVELARALHFAPRLLLVDEMSACLTRPALNLLFDALRAQRETGTAIVYISHYLEEIGELCDRVTVLKDGRLVDTLPVAEAEVDHLSTLMVGRATAGSLYRVDTTPQEAGEVLLAADRLTLEGAYRDVSFAARRGEILGIGGLLGCGSDELARTLFGQLRPDSGAMTVGGRTYSPSDPREAIGRRIAYVPPDRDREGLLLRIPISTNVTLATLPRLSRAGIYAGWGEQRLVGRLIQTLAIRASSVADIPLNLSGGNRQKVVLAKWLMSEADVFVMHNPTRGIDVGSKADLYALMERLAGEGAAIVLLSDELPELIGMSDRIMILRRGAVSHTVARDARPSEEQLITHMV